MRGSLIALTWITVLAAAGGSAAGESPLTGPAQAVRATEQAFAQTLADRDFEAFRTFLSPEAVFFSGDRALRGSNAVAAAWKPYFDEPDPPFSWRAETVEVLDSGTLALSSGPVFGPDGRRVGTFNSIWRRDASGAWKVVFDKGEKACPE
ncbi:MAG: nuclear transport factor 2 family protein [Xanthomonadales bacterium]